MADENKSPARLFVFLARTAPVGVILRRGPSKWVQLIQWHTKADVFRQGQWFHGRIFEDLCDLSPNGKWFAYHAFKPNNRLKNPSYGDRWTAVSKPPSLTAVALWTHQNLFGGGGYFFQNALMLLNHMDDNRTPHPAHPIPKDLEIKTIETYEDESRYMFNSVHLNAMLRDGWEVAPGFPSRSFYLFIRRGEPSTDKAHVKVQKRRGNMTLICSIFDVARRKYETEISHRYRFALKIGETKYDLDGVTWADFDYSKRLVLAKEGKLFSATFENAELVWTELQDFNYAHPSK